MASPVGLGVGDICKACKIIYTICKRYRDAHDEFDEISAKAKSTEVILQRLEVENQIGGNIVARAGPEAEEQLDDNLESLRQDSRKLENLVTKYAKIEQDGPGRRLLWAFKESSNLTDLRRRIGYHEQTLQLWYMTLVYGSLRRLESGQEEIIEAIKGIPRWKVADIIAGLNQGDKSCLERELRKKGVSEEKIDVNMVTAIDYLSAPPIEKIRMESVAKSETAKIRAESRNPSHLSSMPMPMPMPMPYSEEYRTKSSSKRDKFHGLHQPPFMPRPSESHKDKPIIFPITDVQASDRRKRTHSTSKSKGTDQVLMRSKSTSSRPKESYGKYADRPELHIHDSRHASPARSPSSDRNHAEIKVDQPKRKIEKSYVLVDSRPRRASDVQKNQPPPSPLLTVPQSPLLAVPGEAPSDVRPTTYYHQGSGEGGGHRRTRSATDVRRTQHRDDGEKIIVVEEVRSRSRRRDSDQGSRSRDSSTHSYVRVRRSSDQGSSQGSNYGGSNHGGDYEAGRGRRVVLKMDRIDSIPLDEEKGKDGGGDKGKGK